MSPSLDRRTLVPWALLAVVGGVLLAYGGRYLPAQLLAQIAIGGLLLLTLMLPGAARFPWRWPFAAIFTIGVASTVGSVNRLASIEELCRWAVCLATAWIAWRTVDALRRAQFSLAIVGLGTLAAASGLIDIVVHHADLAASFFNRSNDLAAYLLLTLPLTLVLTGGESRTWRTIGTLAFAAQIMALLMTQSRSALLAAGIGLAYLLFNTAGIVRRRMIVGSLATGVVGLVLVGPYAMRFVARFTSLVQSLLGRGDETSTPWRQALLRAAMGMGMDHPLLGTGPGTYATASRAYQDQPGYYSINAHNFYVQLFGETGTLGLLAWCGLFAAMGLAMWRIRQVPAEERAPQTALAAALIAALVHIGFDLDWSVLAIPLLFWLMAGMLLAGVAPPIESETAPTRSGRVIRLAAALVLLIVPTRSAIATRDFQKGDRALSQGDIAGALDSYDKAQAALPHHSAAVAGSRAEAFTLLRRYDDALVAVDEAIHLDPLNAAYPLQKAQLLAAKGDIKGAAAVGADAVRINPYRHPLPYIVLARWLRQLGQTDAALGWLEQGESRFPLRALGRYEAYTPGDRYEVASLFLLKASLQAPKDAAAAQRSRDRAQEVLTAEAPTPGLPAALATPSGTVDAYWAAYKAKKPLVGVLPGAGVPLPPKDLPASRQGWVWVERDRTTAHLVYTRPGVPMRIVDDLELRDGGWLIVRRTGQAAEPAP
ncbi:MAG: O-antigen ligase family protein [Candidatus Sericytochromatia bacterium]|nr:O-antigen ligase family protein [Candidatus Sericytochromatia bacterium]